MSLGIEGYWKVGCKELMLTFTPKGGLWSTTNLLEQMRLFSEKVMSNWVECGSSLL